MEQLGDECLILASTITIYSTTKYSTTKPRLDNNTTGRPPNRSDNAPWIGEQKNCMKAQAVPINPWRTAACAVSPEKNSSTSFGSTGMMMPSDNMSRNTVTRMKSAAARRAGAADGSFIAGASYQALFHAAFHSVAVPCSVLEEVLLAANGSIYGLTAAVWTRDVVKAFTLPQDLWTPRFPSAGSHCERFIRVIACP
jgi:hypothetical protein